MPLIPLYGMRGVTRGHTLVDDEDYATLNEVRWHLTSAGYAADPQRRLMHRVIWDLSKGDGREVDHKNGDTLDNQRSNHRIVTHAQNLQNRRAANRGSSSRYRGVGWDKRCKRWMAQVSVGGKTHFLGRFDDEQEAARAAAEGRRRLLPGTLD